MEAADKVIGTTFGVILLAAGISARLGHPQLLPYEGQTLLQHSLAIAHSSDAHSVMVVLGAEAELIGKGIADWRLT